MLGWPALAPAASLPRRTPVSVQAESLQPLFVAGITLSKHWPEDIADTEDDFAALLAEELTKHGYDVASQGDETQQADRPYALSGSLSEVDCSEAEGKTCGIVIEWTLWNVPQGVRVYQLRSRSEETGLRALDRTEVTRRLLLGGLRSLLVRPKFVAALRSTAGIRPEDGLEEATLARCTRKPLELPGESEEALDATAMIKTTRGIGSAVVVSPDGFLLTAAHVVENAATVAVIFRKGKKGRARVVRLDAERDVALLELEGLGKATSCLVFEPGEAKPGRDVYVIGAPGGEELSFSISRGILSGRRTIAGFDYLQTDASINPGNSGGPLLDSAGSILGIVSWKISGHALEGLGFGVPIGSALRSLALSPGELSSKLLSRESRKTKHLARAVVDSPDPAWTVVGTQDAVSDSSLLREPRWAPPVRGAGYLALATGVTLITVSALTYKADDTDRDSYYAARTVNDIGWITASVGLGAIVGSYVLPIIFRPSKGAPSSAQASPRLEVDVGLGNAALRLRY